MLILSQVAKYRKRIEELEKEKASPKKSKGPAKSSKKGRNELSDIDKVCYTIAHESDLHLE